ncbi:MAG: hypothetical protein J5597_00065 [Spirochaetaceae bacterium]|nr:hypothetical protein [Spirochaetaceae bacterium]
MSKTKKLFFILIVFLLIHTVFAEELLEDVASTVVADTENSEYAAPESGEIPVEEPVVEENPFYEGWKITVPATLENSNRCEIGTYDGKKATVIMNSGLLTNVQLDAIGRALDAAWALPGLDVKLATVFAENDKNFRFVLYPSSLRYGNTQLVEYLPSGLTFSYNTALFYDVVLKVWDLVPRVTGAYVSPDDFVAALYKATIVPDLYMYDNDLVERVERLEKALLSLSTKSFFAKPYQIDESLIQYVKNMYNANKNITKKDVTAALKTDGIKYKMSDIDTIFVILLGIYE